MTKNKRNLFIVAVVVAAAIVLIARAVVSPERFAVPESVPLFEMVPVVVYINLKHRKDRKQEFLTNFAPNEQSIPYRIDAIYSKSNGALGCLKSHIAALEYAMTQSDRAEFALICEDDFQLTDRQRCEQTIRLLLNSDIAWDVIMLSHNTVQSEPTTTPGIIRITDSQTASGYLIKMSYIPALLRVFRRDLDTYEQTQQWESKYCNDQSWKELQRSGIWYAISPAVGLQRKSYSDIQKGVVNYELFSS